MDDHDLKNLLKNVKAAPPGENARKRAVNLSMAEFKSAKKESENNFQGNESPARHKDEHPRKLWRRDMKIRKLYGGLATAAVVVLVAAVSFQQLQEPLNPTKSTDKSEFSTIAANQISSVDSLPGLIPGAKTIGKMLKGKDEKVAAVELTQKDFAPASPMQNRTMAMSDSFVPGPDVMPQPGYQDVGRDKFEDFEENPVKLVSEEPVSTFSADVDTASYAFIRRQINNGVLPQKDAVRIEEMINYFDYDYPLPETHEQPFKPTVTVTPSPWAEGRKLIHIGIKGYDVEPEQVVRTDPNNPDNVRIELVKPRTNLVFLLDVSGSMNAQDKLPLLKNSFKLLLDTLGPEDTVAIVTYAGRAGTVLEPTKASEKNKIVNALENLNAGGSTAGAEGIRQAYNLAESVYDEDAVNRVILATDGDFNVGITNREELKDFIERKRESGIFLSVLGFGQGNLNDHMMQTLAQNGNGVAAYIDTLNEARKVLVEEAISTLFPIAKDVKFQIEFNPDTVAEYRLIGYETRALNREDFNNDAVDAGDIGAGHTVTAIYEITPKGGPRTVDESRYDQAEQTANETDFGDEYAYLKIRYKLPDEDTSKLITTPVSKEDEADTLDPVACMALPPACPRTAPNDVRFSVAVAAFGQLLKGGKYTGDFTYDDVIALAQEAKGDDPFGLRAEFINLVRLAKSAGAMEKNAPARR